MPKTMPPLSKRHHIVPQFYLERFCAHDPRGANAPPMLWVYRRGEGIPRRQQPINTAVRKHFNSFLDKAGRRTDIAEQLLARLDDQAAPVLARVVARPATMTPDERITLSVFFAVTLARTAKHRRFATEFATAAHENRLRELLGDKARAEPLLERFNLKKGKSIQLAEIREAVAAGGIKLKLDQRGQIAYALGLCLDIADWFREMCWALLEAPQGAEFVLSDYPVVISRPSPEAARRELGADVEVTIPVEPQHCFLLTPGGPYGLEAAPREYVREIVRRTAEQADQEVYAARKSVIVARVLS